MATTCYNWTQFCNLYQYLGIYSQNFAMICHNFAYLGKLWGHIQGSRKSGFVVSGLRANLEELYEELDKNLNEHFMNIRTKIQFIYVHIVHLRSSNSSSSFCSSHNSSISFF